MAGNEIIAQSPTYYIAAVAEKINQWMNDHKIVVEIYKMQDLATRLNSVVKKQQNFTYSQYVTTY